MSFGTDKESQSVSPSPYRIRVWAGVDLIRTSQRNCSGCCRPGPIPLSQPPALRLSAHPPACRFFAALASEPAGVRAAVQEATASLASAFRCALPGSNYCQCHPLRLSVALPSPRLALERQAGGPWRQPQLAMLPLLCRCGAGAHRAKQQRLCSTCCWTHCRRSSRSLSAWLLCRRAWGLGLGVGGRALPCVASLVQNGGMQL